MAIQRGIDGAEPLRPETPAAEQELRIGRAGRLAVGTLACPSCDAPVAPGDRALTPAEPIACPYCGHAARVRDFLSLAAPSRPARVVVRVLERPRLRRSRPPRG